MDTENITIELLSDISPIRKIGKLADYKPTGIHKDVLYFTDDTHDVYLNGVNYTEKDVNYIHFTIGDLDFLTSDDITSYYSTISIRFNDIVIVDDYSSETNRMIITFYKKFIIDSTVDPSNVGSINDLLYIGDMKYEYTPSDDTLVNTAEDYYAVAIYNVNTKSLHIAPKTAIN